MNLIYTSILSVILTIFIIAGIDAEVARRDREVGEQPADCIFDLNCW